MSDIGLPPGFGVWLVSLGWAMICALGFLVLLLIAWIRARRKSTGLLHDRTAAWAMGAAVSALVAGVSMWLVNWSGSLGQFAHWIDRTPVTTGWLLAQAALWPVIALIWNRARV
ncbi:MAG: hypothetical protein ACR2HH_04330 [Chthoniobacterales bacterium]